MENFIVSARKYRPATFESVVGQEHITSTLRNAISRGQLAHAYLFCGPRGVGKTTCARIFAKAINCLAPGADGVCGECESCRSFNEGRSFNIHELDAASNNSVDDIRSLTEQVRIPPQIGKYSVYIIDEVHMLSAAAFNAFLKTLEEPPAHAIFILATTEKHKIIPTILSRCQIYDFNRIRVEDGVKYLQYIAGQEGVTCDDESLNLIAQKADGGMRDALSMFDKAVSFCGAQLDFRQVAATLNVLDYDTYFNITDNILAGDYPAALTAFDDVLRKGFSPQTFAAGLNAHFRDLLMCRDAQTAGLLEVTGSLMERYKSQAARCDTGLLFDALSLVTSIDNGLRNATNQRLNVELGLMKLCGLSQKKNTSSERPVDTDTSLASLRPERPSGTQSASQKPTSPQTIPATGGGSTSGASSAPASPQTAGATTPPSGEGIGNNTQTADAKEEAQNISTAPSQDTVETGSREVTAEPSTEKDAQQQSSQINSPGSGTSGETSATIQVDTGPVPTSTIPPEPSDSSATRQAKTTEPQKVAAADYSAAPSPSAPSGQPSPARKTARPSLSGPAIGDLLGKPVGVYETTDNGEEENTALPAADPASAAKIEAAREKFIKRLNAGRPRLAMAFHAMKIEGNKIKVVVPTRDLHDEILRNRTEILTLLSETAHIDGYMQLEVVINEDAGPKKPIKVEDKLKYLTDKNPTLTLLRQKLDMDIE